MDSSIASRTLAPLKIVATLLTVPIGARIEIHDLTDRVASLPGLDGPQTRRVHVQVMGA